MMPWVRAALMSWMAPGRAGEAHVVRPVGGDPVDGQQGAVEDYERFACRGAGGHGKVGGERSQDLHGLGDVPVDGCDADSEPGREPGVGVSAAQVREHEQGLPVRREPAPPCPALNAPRGQQAGEVPQGRAGQIDPRWVNKHVKLRADRLILVDNPSTRSFISSGTPPSHQLARHSTKCG